MKKEHRAGLITLLLGIVITFAVSAVLSQIVSGQIEIKIPEKASFDGLIVPGIKWSGTISDIPISTYQTLQFKEQKVRAEQTSSNTLTIHYEGKAENNYTYHAWVSYPLGPMRTFEKTNLKGNIIEYTTGVDWGMFGLFSVLGGSGSIVCSIIVLIAVAETKKRKEDC